MSQVIDRRLNGRNKSSANRQRFIERYKKQIKEAVSNSISKRSITDMDKGEKINIPARDTSEPIFHHDQGGRREQIHPGNKEFNRGDKVERPLGGGQGKGNSSEANNQGEGADEFVFQLSREEFLELFFEDLALPDLVKKDIAQIPNYRFTRAGHTADGIPTNLDLIRSFRNAISRRIAMASPHRQRLAEIEEQLSHLSATTDNEKIECLQQEIAELNRRIITLPFIDDIDLRYRNRIKKAEPSTQAVMFCLMDVSGSMDENKKDIAKRFFILLYLFLQRNYKKIDLVFIRHHTSAKEVDEQDFFYSRETGGTVVSSALELMVEIMKARYPANIWNIYAAQASDGDNWNADSPHCQKLLLNDIMNHVQYYAYVEILPRHHQSLWEAYANVEQAYSNFAMQTIHSQSDIYPVFRELFKQQEA